MVSCQCFNNTKILSVALVWASIATSQLLYGILVPLLPKIVQRLNGESEQKATATNTTENSTKISLCFEKNETSVSQYGSDSLIIGTLIALQQLTQIVSGIFAGPLVDKIGYDFPLHIGYAFIIGSSAGFSFAESMTLVFVLRGLQGIGSAFVTTAGLSIVSHLYRDNDEQRGVMMAIALSGMSVGVGFGPVFGSVMYQFGGKYAVFLSTSGLMLVIAILQLSLRRPRIQGLQQTSKSSEKTTWGAQLRLIKDPYVMAAALAIVFGLMGAAFVETSLPLHMVKSMCPENWMLGVVFVPVQVSVAVATLTFGWLSKHISRFAIILSAYVVQAVALVGYAFCTSFAELMAPGIPFGLGEAAKNAAITPALAYLVDTRIGDAIYGSAYALADIAMAISFGVGPILAGVLVPAIGFNGTMYVASAFAIATLIPVLFLRKYLTTSSNSDENAKLIEANDD